MHRWGKYIKIKGNVYYNKNNPEIIAEQGNYIGLDSDEITNHLVKATLCKYIRKYGAKSEADLTKEEKSEPSFYNKNEESEIFSSTLSENERIILKAAKELKNEGKTLSQENLFDKVLPNIEDFTQFKETLDILSQKGYLNPI